MAQATSTSVVIIGAGFGGIATAIELRRHGFQQIVILERDAGLGGTWRQNSYPGAACDVPSHLYSFSFAKRRDWSRLCSPQAEILDYLDTVASQYGIEQLLVPNTDVESCHWDHGARRWTVKSRDGRQWETDAVVIATGQLHQPQIPRIDGAEEFAGHSFHSARWDHDYDLDGKRVAVIGNGASAVQFVPAVAERAGQLTVFQRSGNWFLPRRNRPYPPAVKAAIEHLPGVQSYRRWFMYHYGEFLTSMIRHPRTWGQLGRLVSGAFMRHQLRDRDVRAQALPDYTFGCKRVLFSSTYLPALQRDNVELVTVPVARLTEHGVLTADTTERAFDCVIWGTGFHTDRFMLPMEITGTGGIPLTEAWSGGARAHLGVTVPGFPSLFLVYGPNTNTSGGSIIVYEEAQARYIRQALQHVHRRGAAAIDVRPEVEAASDDALQARFAGRAWTQCDSWYRDETGRVITNWPGYMREYEAAVRELAPDDYRLIPVPERTSAESA